MLRATYLRGSSLAFAQLRSVTPDQRIGPESSRLCHTSYVIVTEERSLPTVVGM
jgi:hypothetical protein